MRFLALFMVLVTVCLGFQARAAAPANAPVKMQWVADYSHVLSNPVIYALTEHAKQHEKNTTNQFVTVIIPSLAGWSVEDYARWLGNAWGIGQYGKNNGVLLLVATEDRRVRIEVGSGLRGTLTDSVAQSIIDNEILPHFKKNRMEDGVIAGHKAIIQALGGEYRDKKWWEIILTLILMPFFIMARTYGGGDFVGGGGSFIGGGASGSW